MNIIFKINTKCQMQVFPKRWKTYFRRYRPNSKTQFSQRCLYGCTTFVQPFTYKYTAIYSLFLPGKKNELQYPLRKHRETRSPPTMCTGLFFPEHSRSKHRNLCYQPCATDWCYMQTHGHAYPFLRLRPFNRRPARSNTFTVSISTKWFPSRMAPFSQSTTGMSPNMAPPGAYQVPMDMLCVSTVGYATKPSPSLYTNCCSSTLPATSPWKKIQRGERVFSLSTYIPITAIRLEFGTIFYSRSSMSHKIFGRFNLQTYKRLQRCIQNTTAIYAFQEFRVKFLCFPSMFYLIYYDLIRLPCIKPKMLYKMAKKTRDTLFTAIYSFRERLPLLQVPLLFCYNRLCWYFYKKVCTRKNTISLSASDYNLLYCKTTCCSIFEIISLLYFRSTYPIIRNTKTCCICLSILLQPKIQIIPLQEPWYKKCWKILQTPKILLFIQPFKTMSIKASTPCFTCQLFPIF
uniref:PM448R n=1 Tax=African swine fever virus TaxID=10497 RepID=A0A6G7KUB6_ASF